MTALPLRRSLLAAVLLATAPPVMAAPSARLTIAIVHPWIRPTPPNAPTAAGYLSITNTGRTADRLLGASSPRAKTVELHTMSMAGGVMRMRPLAGGLALPPGHTTALDAGSGLHLMFVAPHGPMKVGERVPAVLRFEKAGAVPVTFTVEAMASGVMEMR